MNTDKHRATVRISIEEFEDLIECKRQIEFLKEWGVIE